MPILLLITVTKTEMFYASFNGHLISSYIEGRLCTNKRANSELEVTPLFHRHVFVYLLMYEVVGKSYQWANSLKDPVIDEPRYGRRHTS